MKIAVHKFLHHSRLGSMVVVGLVLASLLVFALETEFTASVMLKRVGFGIAGIFAVEYILRIWVADLTPKGRLGYIKSFAGIIDLLAFIPALLIAGGGASVVLRSLRLFRLLQILKIGAVSRGINRIQRAMRSCNSELAVSLLISLGLIFFGAVLIYFIEGPHQPEIFGSIPRALWWSMATLTTVGYGDVYPITAMGKVVASFVAVVGIGAVAMPAGIIASAFMNVDEDSH